MLKRFKNPRKKKRSLLSEKLKQYGLTEMLQKDANNQAIQEAKVAWFHGNISRDVATAKLQYGDHGDGYFLVRESSYNNEIVVSFLHQNNCMHYKIKNIRDGFYHIQDGPIMQGLVMVVEQYSLHSHSLPTKLTEFCKGAAPPTRMNKFGRTNLLHQAIIEGDADVAKLILDHRSCPDVKAWDEKGSTALHMASYKGMNDIVADLINRSVDVNLRDSNGSTALEKACIGNRPDTMLLLMQSGGADSHARNYLNEKMPLHEACKYGHTECIKVLLKMNALAWPKDSEGWTPYTLALRYGYKQCAELIENHKPLPAQTHRKEWLHKDLDRNGAVELLAKHNLTDGLFLVRKSSQNPNWFVLVLSYGKNPYHYHIKNVRNHNFYIENGPHFTSLEHLIEYYSAYDEESIQCALKVAITPENQVKKIVISRQIHNYDDVDCTDAHIDLSDATDCGSLEDETYDSVTNILVQDEPPSLIKSGKAESNEITKISANSLHLGYEIGDGEFGSVYRGIWISPYGQKVDIAIKTLHEELMQVGREQFEKEANVMQRLNHQHIVKLIGICEGPPIMMVQELMVMGSMLDYLLDYPEQIDVNVDLFVWAAQIASGMAYLEKRGFVHRDLAARNILLASKGMIKISDFGLSRAVGTESQFYTAKTGGKWPVKWYAPECVYYGTFSSASDVWSYGITLWEMFSLGELPYEDMKGAEVLALLDRGKRLPKPEYSSDSVYQVMGDCWQFKPEDRCTFEQLIQYFQTDPDYYNLLNVSNISVC